MLQSVCYVIQSGEIKCFLGMAAIDVFLTILRGITLVFDALTLPVYWLMQQVFT